MGACLFFVVVLTMFSTMNAVKAHVRRQELNADWKMAADALGLVLTPGRWRQQPSLRGQIDGLSVEVNVDQKSSGAICQVHLLAPTPEDLKLSAETIVTEISARLGNEDLQTGDKLFDARVYIRGEEAEALARLGDSARRALLPLVNRNAKLESGTLGLYVSQQGATASELFDTVRALVGAARILHLDGLSVPEALARNAAMDSMATVRLRNLSVLCREYPRSEVARQAVAKALEDPDRAVRFSAAEFLPGAAAAPVLKALVHSGEEAWVRAEALRVLARKCTYAEISDTVALGLSAQEAEELRQEAVRVVGRAGDHAKVEALVEMADGPPPPLAEALAEAFGQLGGPHAEEALLRLLGHESDRVRALAAHALGDIGTARAVEPLLPLSRGLLGGELQQEARDAVRRIQGRLGDPEAGGLAVVDDQGGALSLPAEEGTVAVVEDAAAPRDRSGD